MLLVDDYSLNAWIVVLLLVHFLLGFDQRLTMDNNYQSRERHLECVCVRGFGKINHRYRPLYDWV